jgi:hypothetical protein
MNPLSVLASAQRCNAAYIEDLSVVNAAFTQLGMSVIGQYKNDTHQAILSKNAQGGFYLTIAGTRIGEGNNFDILDDIWLAPVKAPLGGLVSSGVHSGLDDFWKWVLSNIPSGASINVEGHSLGAERVLLTPLFLPAAQIGELYAFEAPQCATQDYWDAYRSVLNGAVSTVCGADKWYGWPPRQGYVHDAQSTVLWLQLNATTLISPTSWPGGDVAADHDIAEVIVRLQAAVANSTFPH